MQAASCAGNYTTECPADAKLGDHANPWVLTGALVSGPPSKDVDYFIDRRPQPDVRVSIEYNAGYTGIHQSLRRCHLEQKTAYQWR